MPILPKANRRSSKLLKTPKLGVETVPMTLSDESRVFVRRRCAAESTQANSGNGSSSAFQSSRTLGTSMQELKRRITNMKNRIRIRQQLYPNVDESNVDSGGNGMVGTGELWVDKHAPLSFPQLLSEERTNREVLRALRAWDPYVFGRQQPVRPSTALYTSGGQRQQSQISTDENKENGATAGTGNPNDKRPPENCRVIMLSGPPGVGEYLWRSKAKIWRNVPVVPSDPFVLILIHRQDDLGAYCGPARGIPSFGSECIGRSFG
jgi:hypothetical protein